MMMVCSRDTRERRRGMRLDIFRPSRGMSPAWNIFRMQTTSTDIVFACTHCATSYVVDAAAAGVTLQCQRCGQATTVPNTALAEAAGNAARTSELQHQLKENES